MAILSYMSVNCASTPLSQDSTTSTPPPSVPLPTKVILPSKKPTKWSTGVAPGEYGGPPTTTKLRKYWGGDKEDPITSDDLIWNRDFMTRMNKLFEDEEEEEDATSIESSSTKEGNSGFLSLNRAMTLNSMEVDLSKELASPSKHVLERQLEAARKGISAKQNTGTPSSKWKLAPTRNKQEKWDRAAKAATGGSDVMLRESKKPKGDPKVLAAQAREQYFKLKKKMQLLTLGIGGIGVVSAYVSYSPEIAASFGAGLVGSLMYVRMLGNSVDSMADGARGVVKGAAAQPRLLVPMALVMIYNRWNEILVPEYGVMHLYLIPMLVGFFTYKIATFFQAIEEALRPFTEVEEKVEV